MQIKLKLTVAAAIAAACGMASAQDVQVVKIGHVGADVGPAGATTARTTRTACAWPSRT